MNNVSKTILLVEDEAIIALLHKKKLSKYGFNVITADTGEKAIEIASSEAPVDLILMDINLGDGIDGTEAAEIILKIRNIPLVFLSSHTEPQVVDKTEGITSYGYIVKNSGETVLAASIKMAFRLFEANEKLRLQAMVLDQIDDRVTVTDLSGNITYVNNSEVLSLGYSREDLLGSSINKYGEKPDSGATQHEILEETLRNGHWRGEVVNYSIDGEEIIMDCRTQVVYDSRRNPFALCGVATDISEKKRADEEIRKSEEKYRMLVQSTNSIILRWKRDGEILFINDYGLSFFGYDKDELIGKNVVGTIVAEAEDESGINLPELMNRLFDNNELYVRNINQNVTREGKAVWVSWTNNVVIDDKGLPVEMFSVGQDVTDHKEAEDSARRYRLELESANEKLTITASELKESEERFRQLFENAELSFSLYDGIFDKNGILCDLAYLEVNEAYEKLCGLNASDFYDKTLLQIFPETEEYWMKKCEEVILTGNPVHYENYSRELNRYIDLFVYTPQKGQLAFIGLDTTKRKRADDALRESEALFRGVFEDHSAVMLLINPNTGQILNANQAAVQYYGYPLEKILQMEINQLNILSREEIVKEMRNALNKKSNIFDFRHMLSDGQIRDVEVHSSPITIHNQVLLFSIIRDITERKQAEEAEAKQKSIMSQAEQLANLGSWEWDINNDTWVLSENWKRIHGVADIKLTTQQLLPIAHPEDRYAIEQAFSRAVENGEPYCIEHRIIRQDTGEIRYVYAKGFTVFDTAGKQKVMVGAVQDITERKIAEEKISRLLSEKELLLKEVHHRIKNNMNTIKGLLTMQIYSEDNPQVVSSLQSAESRVHSMIMLYDRLYSTDNYRELSVKEYLEPLTSEIIGGFPGNADITIETEIDDFILNVMFLSPLGIIVNELLTNMMKYAFIGRESGKIFLSAEIENSKARVVIGDNGVGIPEAVNFGSSTGFGLDLVKMLTDQIEGSIRIERGEGTRFILEFDI